VNRLICLMALGSLLVGCGDEGVTDSGVDPTWSSIYSNLFDRTCNIACHGAAQIPLMNTAESAYTNLVNVTSATTSCAGSTYVAPMDPDGSLLVQVLEPRSCVARMPLGGRLLTSTQIGVIRTWIANGAENN